MAQLELSLLQSGPGAGDAAQPAFLALPDFASREVLARILRTHGEGAGKVEEWLRATGYMDPCGLGWRGTGRRWAGWADTSSIPAVAGGDLDYDGLRSGSGSQTVRRGECFLLPDGFCVRDPALYACVAAGIGGARRDGVLAEFPATGARQRRGRCRGERSYLRPVVATVSALSVGFAAHAGKCGSISGTD